MIIDQKNKIQICPICEKNVFFFPRYPDYVCQDCLNESPPINENGIRMIFFNIDASGGFGSRLDTDKDNIIRQDSTCYINGVKCIADEARLGGIVIQPVSKKKK